MAITTFTEADDSEKSTAGDFRAALEQLRTENIRGLVLDLRDDHGGSLRAAVDICNLVLSKGEIVTIRGRDHQVLHAYRVGKTPYTDFPVAVLVNGSAPAQRDRRRLPPGQRPRRGRRPAEYGKGTVQEVFDLGRSLAAPKLTVATIRRQADKTSIGPRTTGSRTFPGA